MTNIFDEEVVSFVRALGGEIEYVEPDCDGDKCAEYDPDERRLTICRDLCHGRRRRVLIRLLERL